MPLISIIMSVYNEEIYLKEALQSIFNQTIEDYELIIVDDCSTDRTVEIIKSFNDPRIKLITNETNMGLTKNLNKALKLCRGEFIARMDGDDICMPDRLRKQVEYMRLHPEYMLTGCQTRTFGEQNMTWCLKDNPEKLRIMMLIRPVLAHPTFMMRKELIFDKNFCYDESFRSAQDYDLAQRVSEFYSIGIVQEVLLNYRTHKKQVSSKSGSTQFANADRIRERQLERLGVVLDENMRKVYTLWVKEDKNIEAETFCRAQELIHVFCKANDKKNIYSKELMEKTLKEMLFTWFLRNKSMKTMLKLPAICDSISDLPILAKQTAEIMKRKMHENK